MSKRMSVRADQQLRSGADVTSPPRPPLPPRLPELISVSQKKEKKNGVGDRKPGVSLFSASACLKTDSDADQPHI